MKFYIFLTFIAFSCLGIAAPSKFASPSPVLPPSDKQDIPKETTQQTTQKRIPSPTTSFKKVYNAPLPQVSSQQTKYNEEFIKAQESAVKDNPTSTALPMDLTPKLDEKNLYILDDATDEELYVPDYLGLNPLIKGEISYCRNRYLDDAETRTIGEIFSGKEHTHGQLTLRSQKSRDGMYFYVMFDWFSPDSIYKGTKIKIYVDSSDTPKVRTFEFIVPNTESLIREVRLGITGSDWKNKKATVNAWRIEFLDKDDNLLAQKQSWLWKM